jgi:hypothetical protein
MEGIMIDDNDDAWQALIRFCANGCVPDHLLAQRAPWEIVTYPPKRKLTRKRRVTLSRAMQQASKAGLAVNAATVNADGSITLSFGETAPQNQGATSSEWDEVLQ